MSRLVPAEDVPSPLRREKTLAKHNGRRFMGLDIPNEIEGGRNKKGIIPLCPIMWVASTVCYKTKRTPGKLCYDLQGMQVPKTDVFESLRDEVVNHLCVNIHSSNEPDPPPCRDTKTCTPKCRCLWTQTLGRDGESSMRSNRDNFRDPKIHYPYSMWSPLMSFVIYFNVQTYMCVYVCVDTNIRMCGTQATKYDL